MTEHRTVDKPRQSRPRPLAELLSKTLGDAFRKQGFASSELVTRWADIVGQEIATHSEPEKIQWPRPVEGEMPLPGTLVLRVEGPASIEIQHLSNVVLERVNRFLGWQAVADLRLRQAPLSRHRGHQATPAIDRDLAEHIADGIAEIGDEGLRQALGRLGAAIKRD